MTATRWAVLVAVLAGCGGPSSGGKAETGTMGHMDSGGMKMGSMDSGGMEMGGMQMDMKGMEMMPTMRAHMDSMMRMSPAEMPAMMARHERMASEMMDGMGADMRSMNMPGDARWNALSDSVKRDLAELPGLEGQQLSGRMKAHIDRVRRLIGMHDEMMKSMKSQ